MDELYWPLLWALAGLPVISAGAKYKLSRNAPKDYGYYLEWKLFSTFRLGVTKLARVRLRRGGADCPVSLIREDDLGNLDCSGLRDPRGVDDPDWEAPSHT